MGSFLITFREGLEAALVVGILLSALRGFGALEKSRYIWMGVAAGIVASLFFAWVFETFTSGFEGTNEKIYEGVLMLGASALITHLIFWMSKEGPSITAQMKEKVSHHLSQGTLWMLGTIAFLAVVREGIEIVIFFEAMNLQAGESSLFSAVFGLLGALAVSVVIYFTTRKVPVAKLFQYLSVFLLFIAGGLLGHGIVEFQGGEVIPTFVKPFYDLSSVLSEKEGLGAILKAGFGYDADPSLLAVIAWWSYMVVCGGMMWRGRG